MAELRGEEGGPAGSAAEAARAVGREVLEELWAAAQGDRCGLTREELARGLMVSGARVNFGRAEGTQVSEADREAYWRGLRLEDFALAQGCALGREAAWQRFVTLYRASLTQAAVAMSGSQTVGCELADSLYGELYGLRAGTDGVRRSPLAGYSGRGSLLGWLRTTLAQRHVDHHRRTRREMPLEATPEPAAATPGVNVTAGPLEAAVARVLQGLPEDSRYLLAAYFLEGQTLASLGKLLRVHEATVSRHLKRLTGEMRGKLLRELEAGGMSRRGAEEALATDPRDLEVNLRGALQDAQVASFSGKGGEAREIGAEQGGKQR